MRDSLIFSESGDKQHKQQSLKQKSNKATKKEILCWVYKDKSIKILSYWWTCTYLYNIHENPADWTMCYRIGNPSVNMYRFNIGAI